MLNYKGPLPKPFTTLLNQLITEQKHPITHVSTYDASTTTKFCIVTASNEPVVHLLTDNNSHLSLTLPNSPTCSVWSPDGQHLVVGDVAGTLHFINSAHGTILFSQQIFKTKNEEELAGIAVNSISFVGTVQGQEESSHNSSYTLAATSSKRLLVVSRLDLHGFEAAQLGKNGLFFFLFFLDIVVLSNIFILCFLCLLLTFFISFYSFYYS